MTKAFFRLCVLFLCGLMIVPIVGCNSQGGSLSHALDLLEEGSFADAVPLLERVTSADPGNATAWCNLGVCYLETGKIDEAVKALRKGVDLASGNPEAYEYLGVAYLRAGQLDEARDVLVTANQIAPGSPRVLTSLGVVEMKAGNLKPSFAYTMEALDYDAAYAPALYNIAVLYRDEVKNTKLAERFFRRFLTAAPSDPRAEEARGFLNPETAKSESPAKGLVEKAKRAIEQEEYNIALVALKDALSKDPGYAEAVWYMAILSDHVLDDFETAVAYYSEFKKKFPSDNRSQQAGRRSADLAAELARKNTAVVEADKVPELLVDPAEAETAKAALTAGYKWHKKGELVNAEVFYKRAIELDGSMVVAFHNLGLVYAKTKNTEGARAAFASAVTLKPDYTEARYMLARMQHDLGDDVGALQNLNIVLHAKPDLAQAHYLLGVILHNKKHLEASKIHFERYAELTGKVVQ